MPGEPSRKDKPTTTTIQVDREIKKWLDDNRRSDESNNALLKRLIEGSVDIFVSFLSVDSELPITHTIAFQLGEQPDSVYYYDGSKESTDLFAKPVDREFVQALIKKPKPNMTITTEEAGYILDWLINYRGGIKTNLLQRIKDFLGSHQVASKEENHPDDDKRRKREVQKGTA